MKKVDLFNLQAFLNTNLSSKKSDKEQISLSFSDNNDFEGSLNIKKQLSYAFGDIPEEKYLIADSMINQVNDFLINFRPFFELGIKFDVYLAGGSLRDLLLENHNNIKDLDLILDMKSYWDNNKEIVMKTPLSVFEKMLECKFNINTFYWTGLNFNQKFYFLINKFLNSVYTVEKQVSLDELKEKAELLNNTYAHLLNEKLNAVITLKDNNYKYPMDIIIINSSFDNYLETFSFELCKVFLMVLNCKEPGLITSVFDFYQKIKMRRAFIEDVRNKTMTLNMVNFQNTEIIEKIIEKHYKRIAAKYEDYKLNLDDGNHDNFKQWKERFLHHHSLEKSLRKNIEISSATIVKV